MPTGALDRVTVRQLEEELQRVEALGAGEILLDLGGLEFIDSTGMRAVIGANRRARSHGHRLIILRGPDNVHRRFELSGLASRLPFVDHVDVASSQ